MKFKFIIIITLMIFNACQPAKEIFGTFSDIFKLVNEISKKYNEEVNIRVRNKSYMNIGLINSNRKDLPGPEKERIARDIAIYAFKHYKKASDLSQVSVTFVVSKNFLIFHYNNAMDNYTFDINDLHEELSD